MSAKRGNMPDLNEINNILIAVYALYRIGGAEKDLHTEDIALECFKIAPDRFCWTRYPQYPDIQPAMKRLWDAKKMNLVRGSAKKGWALTPTGLDWLKPQIPKVESPLEAIRKATAKPVDRAQRNKVLNDVEQHEAFQKFRALRQKAEIRDFEFVDVLRCGLDSSPDVIRDRLERLRGQAHDAERKDIIDFVVFCEERFSKLLGSYKS
jgi:hypothetical protein